MFRKTISTLFKKAKSPVVVNDSTKEPSRPSPTRTIQKPNNSSVPRGVLRDPVRDIPLSSIPHCTCYGDLPYAVESTQPLCSYCVSNPEIKTNTLQSIKSDDDNTLSKMQELLEKEENEITKLRSEINYINAENDELKKEIGSLVLQNEQLRRNHIDTKKELKDIKSKVEKLVEKKKKMKETIRVLTKENIKLTPTLQSLVDKDEKRDSIIIDMVDSECRIMARNAGDEHFEFNYERAKQHYEACGNLLEFEALVPTPRLNQFDSDSSDNEEDCEMDEVSTSSTISANENQFHLENPLCRDLF